MIQGFKNAKPACDSRLPITPMILTKLVQALPFTTDSHFTKCMLHAMFVLAFCAFLRVGEITKTHNKTSHYLLFGNIVSGTNTNNLGFIDITLLHFKHSKSSFTIHLPQNRSNPLLCPYKTLLDYISIILPLFLHFFLLWTIHLSYGITSQLGSVRPFIFVG